MSAAKSFSIQEIKVINYLVSKNNSKVFWEELAQFAKDPQSVKLKTIKKTVSELRRKYADMGLTVPFNVTFSTMTEADSLPPPRRKPMTFDLEVVDPNVVLTSTAPEPAKPQNLVLVKRPAVASKAATIGDLIKEKLAAAVQPTTIKSTTVQPVVKPPSQAQKDFELNRNWKRVVCKDGSFILNDNEWAVFKYIHENAGRIITISELRDKVVFQHYGSKLPARWFDSVMRIVNNIRRQIPGLNRRLLTVKGPETSYLFQ